MIDVPRGLAGVAVDITAVGEVRATEGSYRYRSYDAIALSRSRPFEDVVALLVQGTLPTTAAEAAEARQRLGQARVIGPDVQAALPAIAAASREDLLAGLRAALALVGSSRPMRPMGELSVERRTNDVMALVGAVPVLAGALNRLRFAAPAVVPDPTRSHAADLLSLFGVVDPPPAHVAALDTYLVVAAEHGFNVGTFAARVVASSGADAAAAMVGALAAFGGPLHGGAPAAALGMLDAINRPERAADWARERLAAGRRIAGFGHRLYRGDDPRAARMRELVVQLCGERGALAVAVEQSVGAVLAELRPDVAPKVNLELYAGVLLEAVGVSRSMIPAVFASSRSAGWAAHILEQADANRLYRPEGRYQGPDRPDPVPTLEG